MEQKELSEFIRTLEIKKPQGRSKETGAETEALPDQNEHCEDAS